MPCTVFIFKHLNLSEWDCFEFAGRDDVDRSLTRLQIFSTRRFTKNVNFAKIKIRFKSLVALAASLKPRCLNCELLSANMVHVLQTNFDILGNSCI